MSDIRMVTVEEAIKVSDMLDMNKVQTHANELYGTSYKLGQTHIKVSPNSGQAHDNSEQGYIFCGSEYVGQLVAQKSDGAFFVWFNREAPHGDMAPIIEFHIIANEYTKEVKVPEFITNPRVLELKKLKKDELITIIIDLETKVSKINRPKPKIASAPLPVKPKHGVLCHRTSCKVTTDKRGFFCCGGHDDCSHA